MDLQKLFGEQAGDIKKVLEENKLLIIETDSGEWVPKDRIAQIKQKADEDAGAKIKELEKQLEQRNTDLEKLKGSANDNEALKSQIEKLQTDYKADTEKLQSELMKTKKKHIVEMKLHEAGIKPAYAKLLAREINLDVITEHNGNFLGVDDQINILKEGDFKDMFGKKLLKGEPPGDPNLHVDVKNPWTPEHLNIMEQVKITRTEPALAERFKKEAGKI